MAKTKISEFDVVAANNTDINSINIAEGCAPSGINNAIRQLMADLKEQQTGAAGDNFTVGGNLAVTGTATVTGTSTFTGVCTFTAAPVFPSSVALVPSGVIVMWSGSIATIPTGWLICDGTSGTPNLRDRFVVGAGSTYAVAATGGSADAITVSHTHTATVTDPSHTHNIAGRTDGYTGGGANNFSVGDGRGNNATYATNSAVTGISVANSSTGSSGTNANLPPYYALAYIMKS
jgi:hypothetical protein